MATPAAASATSSSSHFYLVRLLLVVAVLLHSGSPHFIPATTTTTTTSGAPLPADDEFYFPTDQGLAEFRQIILRGLGMTHVPDLSKVIGISKTRVP